MGAEPPRDTAAAGGRMDRPDVVVIGAGHNGLAAAFYLARAGRRVLVLERRAEVGGGAVTGEILPGFACPTLTHEVLLHERVARDMGLAGHGVEWLAPSAESAAVSTGGPPLAIDADAQQAVRAIARQSPTDAAAYAGFVAMRDRFAHVLEDLLTVPPPRLDRVSLGDAWHLLQAGRRFRALGARDGAQMLRWLPMPLADLLADTFETDLLRAAIAGPALSGTAIGPRSGGGVLLMLLRAAHARLAGGARRVRGGPGRLTHAMAAAARAAGATIRTSEPVEAVVVRHGRAAGVVAGGREIAAGHVVSAIDPKTTFARLVDPAALPAGFLARVGHVRAAGTLAKVNLALSALPPFAGADHEAGDLAGHVIVGPTLDYMERAFDAIKYGEISPEPWLDVTIPSLVDASLAPAGRHVASIYVHHAPAALRGADWTSARGLLLETVLRVLERYAPGLGSSVVAAQTITPADLETDYGVHGGHVFHGELSLDQLFSMRPVMGYANYDSPVPGLHLCSAGTHPGGFLCGASGRLAAARVLARNR